MSDTKYGIEALKPATEGMMSIITQASSRGALKHDTSLREAVERGDLEAAIAALDDASRAASCLSPLDPHPAARPAWEARHVLDACNEACFQWMLSA